MLVDMAQTLWRNITASFNARNITAFDAVAKTYLQVILDVDTLLGTQSPFLLGAWIARARAQGPGLSNFSNHSPCF